MDIYSPIKIFVGLVIVYLLLLFTLGYILADTMKSCGSISKCVGTAVKEIKEDYNKGYNSGH